MAFPTLLGAGVGYLTGKITGEIVGDITGNGISGAIGGLIGGLGGAIGGFLGGATVGVNPFALVLNSVSLTSPSGWALENINTDFAAALPGNIQYSDGRFSAGVGITTPSGVSYPGTTYYSDDSLDAIKLEWKLGNEEPSLKFAGPLSLYYADLDLYAGNDLGGYLAAESLKSMSAVYPQDLPDANYYLSGSSDVLFGSNELWDKMADLAISKYAWNTPGNRKLIDCDVSNLDLLLFERKVPHNRRGGERKL